MAGEKVGLGDGAQQPTTSRSPSPSTLSTASSEMALISSSSFTSSMRSKSDERQQVRATGKVSPAPRRPGPTSIAAAQLKQQQLSTTAAKDVKQPLGGNKLAHLGYARPYSSGQQQVADSHRSTKTTTPDNVKQAMMADGRQQQSHASSGKKSDKSFAYDFGKLIAYKASRFNEFWSVNRMRYMNWACLLMTLICLVTILLCSKSVPSLSASQSSSRTDQSSEPDQEGAKLEAVDSIERLPLAGEPLSLSPSNRRKSVELELRSGAHAHTRLLEEARRQLRRQQEAERDAEQSSAASSPATASESPLSRVLDDLAGLGLPSSALKPKLLGDINNLTDVPGEPIIRRNNNGATIIMTFGASLRSNETSGTKRPLGLSGLLQELLGPALAAPSLARIESVSPLEEVDDDDDEFGSVDAAEQANAGKPSEVATITIDSGPLLPASPFAGPLAQFFSRRPSLDTAASSLASPPIGPAHSPHVLSVGSGIPANYFLEMLMRASNDLTERARRPQGTNLGASDTTISPGEDKRLDSQSIANKTTNGTLGGESEIGDQVSEVDTSPAGQMLASTLRAQNESRPSGLLSAMRSIYSAPAPFIQSHGFLAEAGDPLNVQRDNTLALASAPSSLFVMPRALFVRQSSESIADRQSPMSRNFRAILSGLMSAPRHLNEKQSRRRWDESRLPSADTSVEWEESRESSAPNEMRGGHLFSASAKSIRDPSSTPERLLELLDIGGRGQIADPTQPNGEELFGGARRAPSGLLSLSQARDDMGDDLYKSAGSMSIPMFKSQVHTDEPKERADFRGLPFSSMREFVPPMSPIGSLIGRIFSDFSRRDLMDDSRTSAEMASPFHGFFAGSSQPMRPMSFRPVFSALSTSASLQRQPRVLLERIIDHSTGMDSTQNTDHHKQDSQPSHPREAPLVEESRWSPKVRPETGRIRMNPRLDSEPPQRFTLSAQPAASLRLRQEPSDQPRGAPSPYTSPNSPLFGFPALKPESHKQQNQDSQKRSFTYHSNHEVAGTGQHQARQSGGDEEHQMPISQLRHNSAPPTGNAMGRRLDEDEFSS